MRILLPVIATSSLLFCACDRLEAPPGSSAVSDERLVNADAEPHNWLNHGRTWSEQRFSPLAQINDRNVSELKLAWHLDLPSKRGLEATPLVADGRMYTTGTWSRVYAVDAASGELLWEYDPQVPPQKGIDACCDVVNRGVALWRDMVYVGTLDGRLIALDAMSGREVWSVQTTPGDRRYTITGAPRIVDGKVLIGNGGAEFDARGFVTAYDAATGEQVWRFYTVPGDPAQPFENPILEQAAETWTGEWWQYGGGGTVWDAISYDPELNLVYLGVGNGTPWNRRVRSPGGGDNLFLASIVALDADTGEYVWHYQTAVLAGPVTYQVNGKQYVAVMAGNGTAFGIESGIVAKWAGVRALNRIVAYTLDGTDELPPLPPLPEPPPPPAHTADAETVVLGKLLYHQYCARCHGDAGISAGVLPDLRYMGEDTHILWDAIVLGGALFDKGMPGFAGHLEKTETDAIHTYVIKRAYDPEYMPERKTSGLAY